MKLEEVSSFKYLGASFTATGQAFGEIKSRINVARAAFNRLQPSLWSRPEITRRTKGRVYESVVSTMLLYGCETWPLRVEFLTTTASAVSSVVVGVTVSCAKLCVIAFTSAPSLQYSCNAGSDGSDMLLAVPKSSVTSSTRCRLRTDAGSEVVS